MPFGIQEVINKMNDFVIVTDSSADLPEDLVRELGVEVLPLSFTVKGQTYHNYPDDREMDPKVFYKMLRDGEMATTAARSAAGSSRVSPPMMFRYASHWDTFSPPRFSSTASSMAARL